VHLIGPGTDRDAVQPALEHMSTALCDGLSLVASSESQALPSPTSREHEKLAHFFAAPSHSPALVAAEPFPDDRTLRSGRAMSDAMLATAPWLSTL